MDAYIYQAAFLCEDCAPSIIRKAAECKHMEGFDVEDSNWCPQGPYTDGGGEADTPQHCDHCNEFLRNPLTADGVAYVKGALVEHVRTGRGHEGVLSDWAEHYELDFEPCTGILVYSDFFRAYVETAIWSSNDESDPETGGDPLDENYCSDDIEDRTMRDMRADCLSFVLDNYDDIETNDRVCEWSAQAQAGHDFWLTRNGHGVGFWESGRGWSDEVGERLDKAAKAFGVVDLYVGDDGKIYA